MTYCIYHAMPYGNIDFTDIIAHHSLYDYLP